MNSSLMKTTMVPDTACFVSASEIFSARPKHLTPPRTDGSPLSQLGFTAPSKELSNHNFEYLGCLEPLKTKPLLTTLLISTTGREGSKAQSTQWRFPNGNTGISLAWERLREWMKPTLVSQETPKPRPTLHSATKVLGKLKDSHYEIHFGISNLTSPTAFRASFSADMKWSSTTLATSNETTFSN